MRLLVSKVFKCELRSIIKFYNMNDPGTGMTPRHQAVVDKIRQRFGQYRKRHIDCQNKYAQSLPARESMERQEAMSLHKRALDSHSRHRNLINMNVKGRQNDVKGKGEQPPNGLEKSTTAILQQQILKRKRDQSLNNSPGHSYAASSDDGNQNSECLSKYQRQDDVHPLRCGVLLQPPATQQEGSNAMSGSAHQVDPCTATSGHPTTFPGRNSPFVREGPSLISNSIGGHGSDGFSNGTQRLSPSSFAPPDFKQEKTVSVSCEGSTHSSSVSGSVVNGLDQGTCPDSKLNLPAGEYLQKELKYFESVVKSFAVESKSSASQQPVQQGNIVDGSAIPGCEEGIRNPGPDTQLRVGHQSQSLQLQEIARQSQLAHVQQRASQAGHFMDGQVLSNSLFQRQQPPQFPMGCVSQPTTGLRHPYPTGKYTGAVPQMSTDQAQMFQDYSQSEPSASGFPGQLHYQRALSSPASQQSLYGFPEDSLATAKLSHMPSQVQPELYTQKFQTRPVSQGPTSMRPVTALDVAARYAISRSRAQLQYQRQSSMPPLQSHTLVNTDLPYQQQVRGFQADQLALSTNADLSNSYHYQRRNSFPIYQRTNTQPHGNFPQGMPQNMVSSQANLLRGVLPTSSSIPGERDSFLMNPNMGLPTSTAVQTGLQFGGRTLSGNVELTSAVSRSQTVTAVYRGNVTRQQHQQAQSMLHQGTDFQGSNNSRKTTADGSFFAGASVSLGDISDRHPSNEPHYSGFSPLGALDKAPSFASLLEQSAISPGNLETTYTGSIPNLDLLGEILGQ